MCSVSSNHIVSVNVDFVDAGNVETRGVLMVLSFS